MDNLLWLTSNAIDLVCVIGIALAVLILVVGAIRNRNIYFLVDRDLAAQMAEPRPETPAKLDLISPSSVLVEPVSVSPVTPGPERCPYCGTRVTESPCPKCGAPV